MRTVRNTVTSTIDYLEEHTGTLWLMIISCVIGIVIGMFMSVRHLCTGEYTCERVSQNAQQSVTPQYKTEPGTVLHSKLEAILCCSVYVRPDHYTWGLPVNKQGYLLKKLPPDDVGWMAVMPLYKP